MNFIEALQALRAGFLVQREGWLKGHYIEMIDGALYTAIGGKRGRTNAGSFSFKSAVADDWVVYTGT